MDRDSVMSALNSLEGSVIREISILNQKPSLTPNEIKNATDAMCLLMKIQEYKDGSWADEMGGASYMRGRSPVTGRYVSRDMGHSTHSAHEKMIEKLEMAYDDAQTQHEKDEIRKEIDRLKSMM